MSHKTIDFKEVKAIVDWVNLSEDVREFSLKYGDLDLYITRNAQSSQPQSSQPVVISPGSAPVVSPPVTQPSMGAAGDGRDASAPPVAATPSSVGNLAPDEVLIKAPMVGTFYAGPKPGAPNFVNVGDAVDAHSVLCIVEVMKLMNNIEAGLAGTVTRIFVSNEQPVEYGQPLMVIRKKG